MASQKQSLPSFVSILSVLSIVFYCAGFLRVELELNEQKKTINDLENNEETSSTSSDVPNLNQLAKKTLGKLLCISSGLALNFKTACSLPRPVRRYYCPDSY